MGEVGQSSSSSELILSVLQIKKYNKQIKYIIIINQNANSIFKLKAKLPIKLISWFEKYTYILYNSTKNKQPLHKCNTRPSLSSPDFLHLNTCESHTVHWTQDFMTNSKASSYQITSQQRLQQKTIKLSNKCCCIEHLIPFAKKSRKYTHFCAFFYHFRFSELCSQLRRTEGQVYMK